MKTDALMNPIVRVAIEALQNGKPQDMVGAL